MTKTMQPYAITLKRTVEIVLIRNAYSTKDCREWVAMQDMDNLQHEGEIASDACKLASVRHA